MLESTKFNISDPITSDNFAEMFETDPKTLTTLISKHQI